MNLLKKENSLQKSFFSDIAEWNSKSFRKRIPADVRANKNKKEIWWLHLTNFYKKYPQNLKYNVKKVAMHFSFDLGWYSIHFDIVR